MKTVVILIGKILLSILELFGRGTSLPGQVVRKLVKKISTTTNNYCCNRI